MKKMKFVISLLFSTGLLFIACQKEVDSEIQNEKTKNKPIEKAHDKSVKEFINPYDFIGQIHNLALQEVFSHADYDILTDEQLYKMNAEVVYRELGIRNLNAENFQSHFIGRSNFNLPLHQRFENMILRMEKTSGLIMRQAGRELDEYQRHFNLGLTLSLFRAIENQAAKNGSLNEDDRVLLLSMLALARNSFQYWVEWSENDRFAGIFDVWKADINGFFEGWSAPGSGNWGFKEKWQSATSNGSLMSERERDAKKGRL